jgi:hypothetical protein
MIRLKHTSILLIFLTFFAVRGFSIEPGKGGTQSGDRDQSVNKVDVKDDLILFKERQLIPLQWTGLQFEQEASLRDFQDPNSISNHYFIRPEIRSEFRLARFMDNTFQIGFTKLVIAF